MSRELNQQEIERITESIAAGRKIEAIKRYREASGEGLKEAKEFIEALTTRLKQADPERFGHVREATGCGSAAAILILLATSAVYILSCLAHSAAVSVATFDRSGGIHPNHFRHDSK